MSEEEIMSLLRAMKEQLNTMEARQLQMDQRQQTIKTEIEAEPQVGSFASRDQ